MSAPVLAARAAGITGSLIDSSTSLLQRQSHDVVRLAMGSPAAEAIPADTLSSIAADIFRDATTAAFDYGPTEGESALRNALIAFYETSDPADAIDPASLIVTTGGMQGLDIACKLFVDRGDLVAVESPTYTNGSATITSYEGELLEVPVDENGMDTAELVARVHAMGRTPRLIYTIPSFQNPSGTTLSLERRLELIELAAEWNAVILEDDPYALLRFSGEPLPSLGKLAQGRVPVIGVRTFSKILAPGLRVGWITAAPEIVARMIDAKQGMDTCTNVPLQLVVAEFMRRGLLDSHLASLRTQYHERKVALQDALAAQLGEFGAHWTDPMGGFFLWATIPGVDSEALFGIALEQGVAFIPGSAFSASGEFNDALRLCFASTPIDRLYEGAERLRRAIEIQLGHASRPQGTSGVATRGT
jgi:2-aminoadipate transaminase